MHERDAEKGHVSQLVILKPEAKSFHFSFHSSSMNENDKPQDTSRSGVDDESSSPSSSTTSSNIHFQSNDIALDCGGQYETENKIDSRADVSCCVAAAESLQIDLDSHSVSIHERSGEIAHVDFLNCTRSGERETHSRVGIVRRENIPKCCKIRIAAHS